MPIGSELLRFKKDQKYLLLDYETCSLSLTYGAVNPDGGKEPNPCLNRPWQVGSQLYKGKELIKQSEDWILWRDKFEVGQGAAIITGFTWEEYHRRATDAVEIRDRLEKHLYDEDCLIVGQNIIGFDLYLDQIYRKLLGRPVDFSWVSRILDTQLLHKAIVLQVTPPKIGTDEWVSFLFKMNSYHKRSLKSSLKYMAGEYECGYNPDLHHKSALYDVELTMAILQKQLYKLEI